MNKRKFGMRVLNISQSRFGTYSHKNLNAYDLIGKDTGQDEFIATYPYEIIGVHRFNYVTGKGFANTVHFYDSENNITVAMTHKTELPTSTYYVGKRFSIGEVMYREGATGRATGNHIHIEIAKGKQSKKIYKDGIWKLSNLINIEDYFFINESIIVKDTKGIKFEFREEGGEDMNDVIHIVRVPRDPEYDYLISIDGNKFGTPYDSTIMKGFSDKNLVKEGWEEVIATNGSIFYYYDKSCYAEGLEKSRGVNNQPFDMHAVSKFKDTMALGCKWNGDLDIDYQRNIQANINNYYGAITGAFGLLKNGYKNTAGAELENIRNGLYSGLSGRTVWGYDSKTDTYMVISHPGVTGKSGIRGDALVELCKKEGMTDAICLDGGGSRWLRFEGKELATTTRKVKNAVILYRRKKKGTILDEPINKPVEETKPQDASPKEEIKELLAKLIELVEKL